MSVSDTNRSLRKQLYDRLSQHWNIFPDTGARQGGARFAIRKDAVMVRWSIDSVAVDRESILLDEMPSWAVQFPTPNQLDAFGYPDQLVRAPTFLDALCQVDAQWPMAPMYETLSRAQSVWFPGPDGMRVLPR